MDYNKQTVYKASGVYKEAGGGGGGGGELPEEYIIGSCVDNPNGLGNSNGLITINTPVFYSQDFIEVSLFSTHNEQDGYGVCFENKNSQPNNLFKLYSMYNYYPSEMLAIIDGTAMSPRYWKNNLSKSYEIKYKINVPYANVNGVNNGTSLTGYECNKIKVFYSPDQFKGGVGRIEVWDSDHFIQKVCLIPAKNKTTGKVGFYDKVNSQFFYSTLTDTLELIE